MNPDFAIFKQINSFRASISQPLNWENYSTHDAVVRITKNMLAIKDQAECLCDGKMFNKHCIALFLSVLSLYFVSKRITVFPNPLKCQTLFLFYSLMWKPFKI